MSPSLSRFAGLSLAGLSCFAGRYLSGLSRLARLSHIVGLSRFGGLSRFVGLSCCIAGLNGFVDTRRPVGLSCLAGLSRLERLSHFAALICFVGLSSLLGLIRFAGRSCCLAGLNGFAALGRVVGLSHVVGVRRLLGEASRRPEALPRPGAPVRLHSFERLRANPTVQQLSTPEAGRWALCFLTALLLIVTVPRFTFQSLAPVALTPMLIAVAHERSWQMRFLHGWSAGFVYWLFVCPWIQHVLEIHGGMGFLGGWGTFLLFCALKAIHLGLFAVLAGFTARIPAAALATAALWTGIERTHGTFGFAWFTLGNAAIEWPWLLGISQAVGVYGLSFLFAYTAGKLAQAVIAGSWRPLVPFVILLGLPLRPAYVPADRSAVLLQSMLTDSIEWNRNTLDEILTEFASHSISAVRGVAGRDPTAAPRLILWPEMPGPFYFFRDSRFRDATVAVAQNNAASLVFTTVDRNAEGAPLNTALLVNAKGELVERYDKVNLVPFGEYIPAGFGWVNRITQEAGDFAPGTRQINFPLPDAPLGVFICYESVFPDYIRRYARDGASVFANLSNDGYFGDSKAREQHLAIVRMRAVENKRWILRATNSGISASIDPAGRIFQRLPQYERTAQSLRYGLVRDVTPYSRYGDWFAWTCLAGSLSVAVIRMRFPQLWNPPH